MRLANLIKNIRLMKIISVNQESLNDIHDFIEKSVQYIFNKKDDK